MSENTTKIATSKLIAEVEELEKLKTGNTPELHNAERRIAQSLLQQRNSAERLKSTLSQDRRKNLEHVHRAIETVIQSSSAASQNATEIQKNMNELNIAVIEASSKVAMLVQEAKENMSSAEQLYMEMAAEFTKTEALVQYCRFASDKQISIKERLTRLSLHEVSGPAMQMMITSVLTDMYQMDLTVTKDQALFDMNWTEAKRLLETTIAQLRSARRENYAEVGNRQTEFLDIDYWTEGRFTVLEEELKKINTRVSDGYNDSLYSNENLISDLSRIRELVKAKDILIAEARLAYNQSVMRENQALAAMDILTEEHQFSLVGKGFEGNDKREAFILRMHRHTDDAEIEVIVSPTVNVGEYKMYFRLDTKAYMDERVLEGINQSLAEDFKNAGLNIDVNPHCCAETLEPFNVAKPMISNAARRLHGIPAPQPHSVSTPNSQPSH